MKVLVPQPQKTSRVIQRTFGFNDEVESVTNPTAVNSVPRPELEALAGRTSQLEIVNLGEKKGNQVYPFVDSSPELNTELRKIEELKLRQDQSRVIDVLERSVLAKVFPETDMDEAGGKLANSTNFLRTHYPERDFDLNAYLSVSYPEFVAKEPRKYEYAIEKFNDQSLVRDILLSNKCASDIYRMLVNLTNHLIQSQVAAEYEKSYQELDDQRDAYSDRRSNAVND